MCIFGSCAPVLSPEGQGPAWQQLKHRDLVPSVIPMGHLASLHIWLKEVSDVLKSPLRWHFRHPFCMEHPPEMTTCLCITQSICLHWNRSGELLTEEKEAGSSLSVPSPLPADIPLAVPRASVLPSPSPSPPATSQGSVKPVPVPHLDGENRGEAPFEKKTRKIAVLFTASCTLLKAQVVFIQSSLLELQEG